MHWETARRTTILQAFQARCGGHSACRNRGQVSPTANTRTDISLERVNVVMQLPLSNIPSDVSATLQGIGKQWAVSDKRPRLIPKIKKHWDTLIDSWAASQLPLAIRKSSGIRGATVLHCTGRRLILADNSPAQWAFSRAYAGFEYSLTEVEELLQKDKIPFTFVTKTAEKVHMTFKCTLPAADCLNKRGWKLCHIDGIGLNTKTKLEEVPIEILIDHFRNFLKPSNHFLIPLVWAGLGEVKEIIEAVKAFEYGQY